MKFKAKLIHAVKEYKFTVILFFILFIISFIFRTSIKGSGFSDIFWSFINAAIILSIVHIFSKTILRIPVTIILSLLAGLDVGVFYVYKNPVHYAVLASIFETNLREASEVAFVAIPLGLIVMSLTFFLMYKASAEMKKIKMKNSIVYSIILFIFCILVLPLFFLLRSAGINHKFIAYNMKENPAIFMSSALGVKFPFVINDFFLGAIYANEVIMLNSNPNKEKSLPEGIVYEKESDAKKIILVIGESSSRNNYSLYGYPIETTPFLDSLYNTGHLSFFNNTISPASITRDAIRLTLSFATPLDSKPFFENKSVVDLANDAGYETVWISNHSSFDVYNSYVDIIRSRAKYFHGGKENVYDDLDLLSFLSQRLIPNKKQFITLHLIGSHVVYETKYDDEDTNALGSEDRRYIHYDKSIHHTDRVLRGIYNMIKDLDENVLIYYYSDHAEVVNTGYGNLPKKDQYKVPLVIMQNNSDAIQADSIVSKYYDPQSKILNTSNNIYILSEIMGYKIPDNIVEKAKNDQLWIFEKDGTKSTYENLKD